MFKHCQTNVKKGLQDSYKMYDEIKKEKVVLMEIATDSKGELCCDYPENNTIPLFQMIGFLDVILMDLKEKALDSLEPNYKDQK